MPLGDLAHVVEVAVRALARALDRDPSVHGHGVERAGHDFVSLLRPLRAQLAELGHVQVLHRIGPQRRAHGDIAAVGEFQLIFAVLLGRRHVLRTKIGGNVVIGEFDLLIEELRGVVFGMRYHTA